MVMAGRPVEMPGMRAGTRYGPVESPLVSSLNAGAASILRGSRKTTIDPQKIQRAVGLLSDSRQLRVLRERVAGGELQGEVERIIDDLLDLGANLTIADAETLIRAAIRHRLV